MRILISFLLVAFASFADLKTNGKQIDSIDLYSDLGYTGSGGDTPHFTAWSGSGDGGNFSGGRIFGAANDAHGWCPSGGNIFFLEITRLDWTTKSNTAITCVNGMSGFGGSGAVNVPVGWTGDGYTWKSYNPWSWNGKTFWHVYRQLQSAPYTGGQSTVLLSPDKGAHWCNSVTYSAHTGSPGCDSANYQTNGDPPADNTKMMFGPANSTANPVSRSIHVQFCQDETCTGMPFNADNYLYFIGLDGTNKMYAACVAKSEASIMDSTQWWYHTSGNATCGNTGWTHTAGSAAVVQYGQQGSSGADNYGYPSSVIYVAPLGVFLMTSYDADNRLMFLSSAYPWGPWKRFSFGPDSGSGAFVTANLAWLNASCTGCNTDPGRWELTLIMSIPDHVSDSSFVLRKLNFVGGGPGTPYTPPNGKNLLGNLKLKVSKDGVNRSLIGNGLKFATLFDDFHDYPSSYWTDSSYTNMHARDLTGSTRCLAAGGKPSGTLIYGQLNSTIQTTYLVDGFSLGVTNYAAQIYGNAGNCTGALPFSGDQAFTIITVLKPASVTANSKSMWELFDPTMGACCTPQDRKAVAFGVNLQSEGGTSLDYIDYQPTGVANTAIRSTSVPWDTSHYWMVTVTHATGTLSTTGLKFYLGRTQLNTSLINGPASGQLNFGTNLYPLLNLSVFGQSSSLSNTGTQALGAVYSGFFIYNRALSAEEIARNYIAIKDALARAPRSIALQ